MILLAVLAISLFAALVLAFAGDWKYRGNRIGSCLNNQQ
jgi:hypothetical protein